MALSMSELVFLTREGCVRTAAMRQHLDEALAGLGWPTDYVVTDLGTLPRSDHRVGYPTPTLLYRGTDLFGMKTPTPPFPEPS
jgi:hypothetical protein